MPNEAPTLEGLPRDVLVDLMAKAEISTVKQLIQASPVAFRLYSKYKTSIFMKQLGHKYVKYGVPAPLVEALHLVLLHECRDEDAFWEEPVFPQLENQAVDNDAATGELGRLEQLPTWGSIVTTCYRRIEASAGENPLEASMDNLSLDNGNADLIRAVLSRKTLRWVEVGKNLVQDIETVARKLDLKLGPGAPESYPTSSIYALPNQHLNEHLKLWMHELRCHVAQATRVNIIDAFDDAVDEADNADDDDTGENGEDDSNDDGDDVDDGDAATPSPSQALRQELFTDVWSILEEQAAAANEREVAARLAGSPLPPTGQDVLLGQIFWSEPDEKESFEDIFWRSGSTIIARLGRMTPQERQEFLLAQYHASMLW